MQSRYLNWPRPRTETVRGTLAECTIPLREPADPKDGAFSKLVEDLLAEADDEEDQLDDAWGLDAQSRLSCCVKVKGASLVTELPLYTKNHAREK